MIEQTTTVEFILGLLLLTRHDKLREALENNKKAEIKEALNELLDKSESYLNSSKELEEGKELTGFQRRAKDILAQAQKDIELALVMLDENSSVNELGRAAFYADKKLEFRFTPREEEPDKGSEE